MGNGTSVLSGDVSLPILGILSVVDVGTAIMVIGYAWRTFNAAFRRLTNAQKEASLLYIIPWFGLCCLSMASTASLALGWGYSDWVIYQIGLYVISGVCFVAWIRRTRKQEKTVVYDRTYWASTLYLGACTFLCLSILLEMIALGGITGTALGLNLGPFQVENFLGGKVLLFNGLGLYGIGILFFGTGCLLDGAQIINSLRGEKTADKNIRLNPDSNDDRIRKITGVDKEDGDVPTSKDIAGWVK